MLGVIIVAGAIGAVLLAIIGNSHIESASGSSTSDSVSDSIPPDAIGTASPDLTGGDEIIGSTPVAEWRKSGITTDYGSWPTGDAIWDICRAIAKAEGYDTNGAAFRLNNPGDISDGASIYGTEWHDHSNITKFPTAADGWNWLYNKIKNHVEDKSKVFPKSWTITEFAKKYAGNWENWKNIVGQELQVNPDVTTFAEYVGV